MPGSGATAPIPEHHPGEAATLTSTHPRAGCFTRFTDRRPDRSGAPIVDPSVAHARAVLAERWRIVSFPPMRFPTGPLRPTLPSCRRWPTPVTGSLSSRHRPTERGIVSVDARWPHGRREMTAVVGTHPVRIKLSG